MDAFVKKVLKTMDTYKMVKSGQTVVVGVSGGFDSTALLYSLYEIKNMRNFSIAVAHINHCFREEADEDMLFVKEICESKNIPFYPLKIKVSEYAEKNKISFETAGREIRYNFFNEVGKKYNDYVIATAHNANDSVESFFMHLMRGSGLNGLTGIRPVMNNIIRPLIEVPRSEIEDFCLKYKLNPKTDKTNLTDDYKRNDIRHNIVEPVTKRCSIKTLTNTMEIIGRENDFMEGYVRDIIKSYVKIFDNVINIKLTDFNTLHLAVKRRILRMTIEENKKQISKVHIDDIIKMAEKGDGNKFLLLPGNIKAIIERGMLKICLTK